MGHLDEVTMDHVNTAIAISFGLGTPREDAEARAMMQRLPAYTPAPSHTVATDPTPAVAATEGIATATHHTDIK